MSVLIYKVEVSLRKLVKDGWKNEFKTSNFEVAQKELERVIQAEGHCTCCGQELPKASYKMIVKINDGYGKNHETGSTAEINFKGRLSQAIDIFNKLDK